MEFSATQKKTIALGNLLAEQLSQEPSADMASRWMSHYIAEQIVQAEAARGPKRVAANERCFRTILQLWEHQNSFPSNHRPFQGFDKILAALACLDPTAPRGLYHQFASAKRKGKLKPDSVGDLVELVCSLDSAARVLIEMLLVDATEKTTDERTRAFLANASPGKRSKHVQVVSQLVDRTNELDLKRGGPTAEERIRDRIEKLQRFETICRKIQHALTKELEASRLKKT